MNLSPETALVQLRKLYEDAHHCPPGNDDLVLKWAGDSTVLEAWATNQIRYRGWGFNVVRATVDTVSRLYRKIQKNTSTADSFDPLFPVASAVDS